MLTIVLAIAIIGGLFYVSTVMLGGAQQQAITPLPPGVTPTTAPPAGTVFCSGGQTQSFDINPVDQQQQGTAIATDPYIMYYQGQKIAGVGSTALTKYAPSSSPYTILFSGKGTYYNKSVTGYFDSCVKVVGVADGAGLTTRGTISRYQYWNPATATSNANNTGALAMAVNAPQTVHMSLQCSGTYKDCVDVDSKGYLTMTFAINTTEFQTAPDKFVMTSSDAIIERTSIAQADNSFGTSGRVAFKITPTAAARAKFANTGFFDLAITYYPSASVEPTGAAGLACGGTNTAGDTFVGIRIRQSGWTVNSVDGTALYGVENDAGTAIYPVVTETFCYS